MFKERKLLDPKKIVAIINMSKIKNPQGHSSFQWHGSILSLFHLELHMNHGLDYKIVAKNQFFLVDS
jgi:hypothetical protein